MNGLYQRFRWVRLLLIFVGVVYILGLAWGYVRLPWAAVKYLGDYEVVARMPAVSFDGLVVSGVQRRYLQYSLVESPTPITPKVRVAVKWNALICARVRSGHHLGYDSAEDRESLYVCVFGMWVPVYTFWHAIT